jgi:hypothetical protein
MAATSNPFAEVPESERLLLARLAQTFQVRPSELLQGSPMDFQIDLAVAVTLWRAEQESAESADGAETGRVEHIYW